MANVRAGEPVGTPIRPVVAAPSGGRRRRPSGEPPPLPRSIAPTTKACAGLVAATAVLEAALAVRPLRAAVTAGDVAALDAVARLHAAPVTAVAEKAALLGSPWTVRVLVWGTVAVLVVARRVHHLVAYLVALLLTTLLLSTLTLAQGRMRPAVPAPLGDWDGYAHPSLPVGLLALAATGAVCTVVPLGPWRGRAAAAVAAGLAALGAARLYLGVDHPTDVVAALALGGALPLVFFRLVVPEEEFPVSYRGGTRAHVDITGRRGAALVQALQQQLGLTARSVEPFGLAGSAGSMPLRLMVTDASGRDRTAFGKLYTITHLRSDRWYKLARMVLYGRLEDEKPFSTVRRLVEYEDHLLRLLRDAGLPVPQPYGLVEITPEREYLVVMELFEGAEEIGEAELTDAEIDQGLRIVRRLWEAGVAHRDIKPSNLLVRDGRVLLIDVAFAAVRPTPWRQAVDLADMMLTLALASSAERVYARALQQFAPEDVAEAFAASRSITVPTQLRARLKADGRDLPAAFRALAPRRRPVPIQLWGFRRALVTLGVVAGAVVTVAAMVAYARVANLL